MVCDHIELNPSEMLGKWKIMFQHVYFPLVNELKPIFVLVTRPLDVRIHRTQANICSLLWTLNNIYADIGL